MAIELRQDLRLSQQLVMTPQLQQAIKLLQLNQLELVNVIEQEMQENPVLEEMEGDEETPAEISDATRETDDRGPDEAQGEAAATTPEQAEVAQDLASSDAAEGESAEAKDPSDAEKIADIEWENYMESNPQTGLEVRGGDDERPSIEATATRRPTLSEHLDWQIGLSDFTPDEVRASQWILGNLDERGYLCSTVEEVARQSGEVEELVEATLAKVQVLDPAGVAARDLRECLLLQVAALDVKRESLVYRILNDHFALLEKRDFRGLTRALGVAIEEVAAAAELIGSLEPRPGRSFGGEDPIYITPDIYVYKLGEEYHIQLNEDGMPRLKINSVYRDVSRGEGVARDTKEYVHEKVRSAMWLIKSIHQRQRTMYKVMQSIIRYQREFFDKGIAYLKPLNLRDVADDIEMHESTVSRVTTNKYVHTPQGIFELKFFFDSCIGRFEGEAIASVSVKEKIRKIITNEDSRRPMSDQRIAEMLKSANINIARRTVTKYREAMHILSSTKRRQVG